MGGGGDYVRISIRKIRVMVFAWENRTAFGCVGDCFGVFFTSVGIHGKAWDCKMGWDYGVTLGFRDDFCEENYIRLITGNVQT